MSNEIWGKIGRKIWAVLLLILFVSFLPEEWVVIGFLVGLGLLFGEDLYGFLKGKTGGR